ncbi:MAG TPA: ABC transporter permease [Candidatus Limnocylindrales bacterium]|nr:ABC transporter permease [Candidatus Limnocylindrales bacterium]
MTAIGGARARPTLGRRLRSAAPYLLLLPGGLWLLVFFFVPMATMFSMSLQEGTLATGFQLTFNFEIYPEVIQRWSTQLVRSFQYAFMATVAAILIGYPLAYTIAFRGGRFKSILLLLVILPFFTSYLIRTISWKFILADQGFVLGTLKEIGILESGFHVLATGTAVISGITYNLLPFAVLPIYVSLEKIDKRLLEAAGDLYSSRISTFLRVTLPLSMPGLFAATLLVFIPGFGDFVNAEFLGARDTTMAGNVVQRLFLTNNDYPQAAAISFLMMGLILVGIVLYTRLVGTEELTR